jgi:hypothetical protein
MDKTDSGGAVGTIDRELFRCLEVTSPARLTAGPGKHAIVASETLDFVEKVLVRREKPTSQGPARRSN